MEVLNYAYEYNDDSKFASEFKDESDHSLNEDERKNYIRFGSMKVPSDHSNLLMLGAPGTGKTALLMNLVNDLDKLGKKAIIYDYNGEYVSKFYDPSKDTIINILDKRGTFINVLESVKTDYDVELTSNILVKEEDKNIFFVELERIILRRIINECIKENKLSNTGLFELLDSENVDSIIKDTVDVSQLSTKSAIATLRSKLSWIKYTDNYNFSIDEWVKDSNSRFIFITGNPKVDNIIKSSAYVFIVKVLSSYKKLNDTYIILDNLTFNHNVPFLDKVIAEGRENRVSIVCSGYELRSMFSDDRTTIMSYDSLTNFRHFIILRQNNVENAKSILSKLGNFTIEDELLNLNDLEIKVKLNDVWNNAMIVPNKLESIANNFIFKDDIKQYF